eukprot:Skav208785  [mRNA]  locus=scaffold931:124009:125416:- [translate_table: standard]
MGHRPKWYWEEVMRRRGMDAMETVELSGYEDLWLDQLQASAQSQVLGCDVHGGRYWELNIDLPKLYKATAKGSRHAFLRRLSIHLGQTETFLEMPEDLPVNWRDTVCVPSSCNQQVLVNEVFEERFARPLMGPNAARKLRNVTFQDVVQIQELADWSSIKIDFAIGGVDRLRRFWLERSVADHMPTMTTLFSGRIAFAHQEQLRENSEQVLTSLANFLGVEHSFQTSHFPRYNSVGGNRTDLCYNQSLVRELQRHLEPEYLMQEEILKQTGQSIPEALRKRITRCDRSETAHCPLTVCTDDVTTGIWRPPLDRAGDAL